MDMKATGIVRRVDSLGRVVIPKEIRHTLRIKEGSPLEIYTEKDGGVTFRKYSPLGDLQDFATQMCDSIRRNTGCIAAVSDRDSIIAQAGGMKRELMDKPNSPENHECSAFRVSIYLDRIVTPTKYLQYIVFDRIPAKHI